MIYFMNLKVNYLSKSLTGYGYVLFILFFLIFPFGQLLRIETNILNIYTVIHPIDFIALLSIPFLFYVRKDTLIKILGKIIFIFITSWLFSLIIFKYQNIIKGLLYLARLIAYYSFANLIYYLSISSKTKRRIISIVFISILLFMFIGLYQFMFYYDLRDLYYVGWDNHYYRLSSTLLDPGYSAIVFIIGLIILLKSKIFSSKYIRYILVILFLLSILLTFSRAGYVSLLIVLFYIYKNYLRNVLIISLFILLILYILPKPRSSGVELNRTFSILSRLNNYKDTMIVFTKYPLLGIGFNNLCLYRTDYLNVDNIFSHSCSGSDSSILLILASTGVVGTLVFFNGIYKISFFTKHGIYNNLLRYVFLSIIVGSFFNNSLFYNFLMGLLAVFIGLVRINIIPDK